MLKYLPLFLLIGFIASSCSSGDTESTLIDWETVRDSSDIAYSITNLDGPEAVRYDPELKAYFISNFTGGGNEQDSTGFITKADPEGNIITRKFMTGTEEAPLHAPRGMFIIDETLWAADVLGVHAFNKETGEQTDFIDFTKYDIGFLNDISASPTGTLYVTDTGYPRIFKIENGTVSVHMDSLPASPNGITLDPETGNFVLAPWNGAQTMYSFDEEQNLVDYGNLKGGFFDGLEFIEAKLLIASQQDSSIRMFEGGNSEILIKTPGRPADIGINTNLNHVAVPYIALDRVDIWNLNK